MQSARSPSECDAALPPPPSPFRAGDVVAGKYRLEQEIGEGGMGTVWVATNTTIDMRVALKILRVDIVGATERMLREARAAAPLHHPAIVRVFDFGVAPGGHAYIVMELLEGESLASLLQREGRLTPQRAVQLLLPVAEGLEVAHSRGIVHRDLKPDNIFLATDDSGRLQPKIVDFGVAKILRPSCGPRLTGVSVVGTPQYMSPEQAVGDDVDQRADVWALSVVLHELITDEYVFDGANVEQVLRAVMEAPAASLVEKAGVDEALWSIVERGLSKERDERWSTALEMARALAAWLLDHGVEEDVSGASVGANWLELPTPPRPTRRSARPTVAGVGPEAARMPEAAAEQTPVLATPVPPAAAPAQSVRSVLHGRAARVKAILAAAATLSAAWLVLPSHDVGDEAVAAGLPVARRADFADGGAAEARSQPVPQPPIQAESAATAAPSVAATAGPSTSAARRSRPPPRRPRAEVDFGF